MFLIEEDGTIHATRGDMVVINVSAEVKKSGAPYTFTAEDKLRIKVFEKKNCNNVVLEKVVTVAEDTQSVDIVLNGSETKFGEIINKPTDYWYEVELNFETEPQTIVGYDDNGPKVFKLYPEGRDI